MCAAWPRRLRPSTTKVFNDQIAAIEQAAADGDQAAMVAAAETINKQFVSLAAILTQLSERPVTPALATVLTDIATALAQMSSLSYTGHDGGHSQEAAGLRGGLH